MTKQRKLLAAIDAAKPAAAKGKRAAPTMGEEVDYEEYRKQFEPVAPWKRDNIPDYGPVQDKTQLVIFFVIGVFASLFYEFTDYFDQIARWIAYTAIWFPLWFRLLTRVSPQLTEEDEFEKERLAFKAELEQIQNEAEATDD